MASGVIWILSVVLVVVTNAGELELPLVGSGRILGFEYLRKPKTESECISENRRPGTCLSRLDCSEYGGIQSGPCIDEEVCCEINMKCGKVSRAKKTVIRNPSPIPRQCAYYFRPYSKYVCQLKITFNTKLGAPTVPPPNVAGEFVNCDTSYLKVGNLRICGVNNNQHIYLPFAAAGNIDAERDLLIVYENAEFAATDYWDIVVTQIECPPKNNDEDNQKKDQLWDWKVPKFRQYDNDLIAPDGCLQYFTERRGVIESFNSNNGRGPYFGNLTYAICFKKRENDRGIVFEATKFNLTSNGYIGTTTDLNCFDPSNPLTTRDYLLIPDSRLTSPDGVTPAITIDASRYCGTVLQDRRVSYTPPGPFVITVNSDNKYTTSGERNEVGFVINYTIQ